jgi:hypothetical protein
MKRVVIALLFFLIVLIGYFIGEYIVKIKNLDGDGGTIIAEEENIEKDDDVDYEELLDAMSEDEIKLSPNAMITKETYYKECGHTKKERVKISPEDVNLSHKEMEEKYKDYTITEFTESEVVLHKEEERNMRGTLFVKKQGRIRCYIYIR